MFSRFFKETVAAAMALLSLNCVAQTDDFVCTTATLRGTYGFKIHADLLGILTGTAPSQTLHRLANAGVIDAVALATFDGFGGGHQKDFGMLNGTRTPGEPPLEFETDETLTYTLSADCSGQMQIIFPGGKTITTEIIVLDRGKQMYGVVSGFHSSPSPITALDGPSCSKGCDFGIQTGTIAVRVDEGGGASRTGNRRQRVAPRQHQKFDLSDH
jgi:hypothetical protein